MPTEYKIEQKYVFLTELFISGINGNVKAYNQFLHQVKPLLRAVINKRISSNDSEDTLQEILISIHKARHTYDGKRPLIPWLYAIAQFRIIDSLRKIYSPLHSQTVHIDNFEEILACDVTKTAYQTELLDETLSQIPVREQNILTMMHIEGYTVKEISQKLLLNESTIKVSVHRTIKKLREKISL